MPPKGATIGPQKALCDTCPRNETKPDRLRIQEVKRIHEIEADPHTCFLAQGVICMGPAIRSGCGEACLNINMPCRGCFGPVEGVQDSGANFISAISTLLDAESDEEVESVIETLDDPAGYLYRFTLPSSILRKRMEENKLDL